MAITSDWHIHTHCSCDSACMEFETLINNAKKHGITDFGVSDHYHTRLQEADIAASRVEFDKAIENHPELKGRFHFGIEATPMSKWEVDKIAHGEYSEKPTYGIRHGGPANAPVIFDFDDEFIEKYKIEYIVTGVHWPMYCDTDLQSLLSEYHRQYMFAATHPYTDILAHYTWYDTNVYPDVKNPFADFSRVSETMRSELKHALLENKVALELNGFVLSEHTSGLLPKTFVDEYLGWFADMQKSGVIIAQGCDCHYKDLSKVNYDSISKIYEHYGIDTDKFYCL
ncbi:MAG: hypothetical protein IJF58_04490 [Clostridia bacterium]|nr:hypothetical protein [Clostridia bacterium]